MSSCGGARACLSFDGEGLSQSSACGRYACACGTDCAMNENQKQRERRGERDSSSVSSLLPEWQMRGCMQPAPARASISAPPSSLLLLLLLFLLLLAKTGALRRRSRSSRVSCAARVPSGLQPSSFLPPFERTVQSRQWPMIASGTHAEDEHTASLINKFVHAAGRTPNGARAAAVQGRLIWCLISRLTQKDAPPSDLDSRLKEPSLWWPPLGTRAPSLPPTRTRTPTIHPSPPENVKTSFMLL